MRPIDADKVMEEINRIGGHNLCEWETIGVKALIGRQNTLAVVPYEEFEDLQRRYDLAVAEIEANAKALVEANIKLDAMRGAANSLKMHYENAKQETAREIFAEIDTLGTYNPTLYAELKKKYTEDGK